MFSGLLDTRSELTMIFEIQSVFILLLPPLQRRGSVSKQSSVPSHRGCTGPTLAQPMLIFWYLNEYIQLLVQSSHFFLDLQSKSQKEGSGRISWNLPSPEDSKSKSTDHSLTGRDMRPSLWVNCCPAASPWDQTEASLQLRPYSYYAFFFCSIHFKFSPSPENTFLISHWNFNP